MRIIIINKADERLINKLDRIINIVQEIRSNQSGLTKAQESELAGELDFSSNLLKNAVDQNK